MKYYHNPRCRKSREGIEFLAQKNIHPTIIEYLKNPITTEEMKEILTLLNYSPKELIRKNEIIYKQKIKDKSLTNDELIEWLLNEPKLMERPILVNNQKAVIGRPKEKLIEVI